MKINLRRLALLLSVIVMVASVFAGCKTEINEAAAPKESSKKTDTDSIKNSTPTDKLEPATIRLYFMGDKKELTDKVWETISNKYRDQLNADFEVDYLGSVEDYKQKIIANAASGDDYDMNFDGNWVVYAQMINNEAYLDLTDILPVYAPDLYTTYQNQDALGAASVNGRVMCLPWTMSMNQRSYYRFNKRLADEAGLTFSAEKGLLIDKATLEDAEEIMLAMVKTHPEKYGSLAVHKEPFLLKHELVDVGFHNLVYDINDPTCQVMPFEQTEAFRERVHMAKKWNDLGIIPPDAFANHGNWNGNVLLGEEIAMGGFTWHEWRNNLGKDKAEDNVYFFEMYPKNKYSNRTPLANIMAVNANAANPERALMFMNLMETDQEMFDMVLYDIKDETYVLDGEKAAWPEGMDGTTSNYMNWIGCWAMWKPQFLRPDDTYGEEFWALEAEKAAEEKNINTPLLSFFPDSSSINAELSQRSAIADMALEIEYGEVDDADAAVDAFIEANKEAGTDAIVAEIQTQIDAFLGN